MQTSRICRTGLSAAAVWGQREVLSVEGTNGNHFA